MRYLLGASLLTLPFIVVTVVMVRTDGWTMAATVWVSVLAIVACIALGAYFLLG